VSSTESDAVTTDAELIASARGGSHDALEALFRRYWPLAWQWAYALTGSRERSNDLAKEAFVRAVSGLARFDVERPFRPWLKRILLNAGIDELRRHRSTDLPLDWFEDRLRPGDEDELRESNELVAAVRSLQPARREVIVLHYWLDLSADEIAARLGIPYGTVASRLSRALADLRVALEEHRVG
jgi:RNA polymerase sigma-70 factor, ECF subfamily